MNNKQFNQALALTRCRGKSAEAARLHFVAGLSISEAAHEMGVNHSAVSRTVASINKQIEGIKMTARKLGIFLAEDSLKFLSVIQNKHASEEELNLSSAVNLCIQFSKLVSQEPLPLTVGELLLCCDVLNGGAHLTKFDTPDSVSIERALDSMRFSLIDAGCEPGVYEKWTVVESAFQEKLGKLSFSQLFTLAIATRHFWGADISGKQSLTEAGEYQAWAKQWVK